MADTWIIFEEDEDDEQEEFSQVATSYERAREYIEKDSARYVTECQDSYSFPVHPDPDDSGPNAIVMVDEHGNLMHAWYIRKKQTV